MKYKDIRKHLSAPRLNRYHDAVGQSKPKAVRLYKTNLRIAQAYHPLLGVLEVVIRNGINNQLSALFADPDWIINEKAGFMNDASLTYTHKRTGRRKKNTYLKSSVEKAERRIRKTGAVVTSGKVIAEQSLGFLTSLFEVHHYKLLKGSPIKMFINLPAGFGRKEVHNVFEEIRLFRNRINHNEPICFDANNIDFSHCEFIHESILNIFEWIDPNLKTWVNDIDSVEVKIRNGKTIL